MTKVKEGYPVSNVKITLTQNDKGRVRKNGGEGWSCMLADND
jgi:hypothetical protein